MIIFKDVVGLIFAVDLCCFFFSTSIESASTSLFLGLAMVFLDLSWRVEQKDARYVKESFWPPLTVINEHFFYGSVFSLNKSVLFVTISRL